MVCSATKLTRMIGLQLPTSVRAFSGCELHRCDYNPIKSGACEWSRTIVSTLRKSHNSVIRHRHFNYTPITIHDSQKMSSNLYECQWDSNPHLKRHESLTACPTAQRVQTLVSLLKINVEHFNLSI